MITASTVWDGQRFCITTTTGLEFFVDGNLDSVKRRAETLSNGYPVALFIWQGGSREYNGRVTPFWDLLEGKLNASTPWQRFD